MRIELSKPLCGKEIGDALGVNAAAFEKQEFSAICTDSRLVMPGDMFFALRGEREDGHRYTSEATARGATLLVTEEAVTGALVCKNTREALCQLAAARKKEQEIPVVAITGSVGKTGAKDAIAAVLGARYRVHKTKGNQNNDLGVAYTLLSCPCDSEVMVLELGSNHPGEMEQLSRLVRPDVGVITAIGRAHMGAFGSIEAILREKASLCAGMKKGPLILNYDNPYLASLSSFYPVLSVGTGENADFLAKGVFSSRFGTSYTLHTKTSTKRIFLRGTGRPRIYASLFAVATAHHFGIPLPSTAEALFRMEYAEGRQNIEEVGGLLLIDDAYNASPESMEEGLRLLSSVAAGRVRYAVLGDMLELGDCAAELHREVGRTAAANAEKLYAFGSYAEEMAKGASLGGMTKENIHIFPDAASVISAIIPKLSDGYVVLVKASHALGGSSIAEAIRARGRYGSL